MGTLRHNLVAANFAGLLLLAQITLDPVGPMTPRWSLPPTDSALEAVTLIAQRQVHGLTDDGKEPREISRLALHRTVYLTCGEVSMWAVDLLTAAGYEARLSMAMTLDEWTGDNGHTIIGVRESTGWVAYDIDRKVRWTDKLGRPLSMREWIERVPTGDYDIVPLLGAVDEVALRAQDRRYAHVPFVLADDELWFASPGDEHDARLISYGESNGMRFRPVATPEWHVRFYDGARSLEQLGSKTPD